mgnify:CR=1 FL=1
MQKRILISLMIMVVLLLQGCSSGPSPEIQEKLAQCLSDKGVVMFGAYWCSHCQQQKKMFGDSWEKIKSVECSLPGGKGQTEVCVQAGIQSYPTWEFAPNDRLTGALSFEQLSAKTGCQIQ